MSLDRREMALMGDEHLIASVHAAFDDLTTTDLERELLKRLEARDPEDDELLGAIRDTQLSGEELTALAGAVVENVDITVEMLELLTAAGLDTVDGLRDVLARDKAFRKAVNEHPYE